MKWRFGLMIGLLLCFTVSSLGAVTMAWDASARAQGYTLSYRQEGAASVQVLDTGPATTAVVDHLQPGHPYYFAARAYNTAGMSGYSNEVTVLAQAPAQEINTYTMADGKFAWDWIEEPDPTVTHYLIECGRQPKTYTVTSQSYPITRLVVKMTDVVGRNQGTWYCQQVLLAGTTRGAVSNELPFALLGAGTVLRGINK